jgi:RimJ/RimL family protein N-acetyltransferase
MHLDRGRPSLRHFEPTRGRLMTTTRLRPVESSDLHTFFEHQCDPVALRIGRLTSRERAEFDAHWASILADPLAIQRTVECDGAVVGYVGSFVREGLREVAYWYGREHWGKGIATSALREFLSELQERPLFARVTVGHTASRRVLEKVGFYVKAKESIVESSGAEVEEYLLQLD